MVDGDITEVTGDQEMDSLTSQEVVEWLKLEASLIGDEKNAVTCVNTSEKPCVQETDSLTALEIDEWLEAEALFKAIEKSEVLDGGIDDMQFGQDLDSLNSQDILRYAELVKQPRKSHKSTLKRRRESEPADAEVISFSDFKLKSQRLKSQQTEFYTQRHLAIDGNNGQEDSSTSGQSVGERLNYSLTDDDSDDEDVRLKTVATCCRRQNAILKMQGFGDGPSRKAPESRVSTYASSRRC